MDPFTVGKEIRPKRTWRNELSKPETVEVKKLVEKIQALKAGSGAPLTGVQIMTTFVRRRIQPLQLRSHGMWEYSGSEDPTRVSTEDYSPTEVEKKVRSLTKLTSANPFPGPPSVAPFDVDNPIPEVRRSQLAPLPSAFFLNSGTHSKPLSVAGSRAALPVSSISRGVSGEESRG